MVLSDLESVGLLSHLVLLTAESAAAYVVELNRGLLKGKVVFNPHLEEQLLQKVKRLLDADSIRALPQVIAEHVSMRSMLQEANQDCPVSQSLVWLIPTFLEEYQRLKETWRQQGDDNDMGDGSVTHTDMEAADDIESVTESMASKSAVSKSWFNVETGSVSESGLSKHDWQLGQSQVSAPSPTPPVAQEDDEMTQAYEIPPTQPMGGGASDYQQEFGCNRAAVLLICELGVLSLKRVGEDGNSDLWFVPGGILDLGESFKEAALRIWEEQVGFEMGSQELVFSSVEGNTSYLWCLINSSGITSSLQAYFSSRDEGMMEAVPQWRWQSLVEVADALVKRDKAPTLEEMSLSQPSGMGRGWGKDWRRHDMDAVERLVSVMEGFVFPPERDPDLGPIPLSPSDMQTTTSGEHQTPLARMQSLPPIITASSSQQRSADSRKAPLGSYVVCNYEGRCGDCALPLTLGHPIIKRVPAGESHSRWCHVICHLAGTPPPSRVVLSGDERFPRSPPVSVVFPSMEFSSELQWVEVKFVEVVGDWMAPSASLLSHRYIRSLIRHYGASVVWEVQGDRLELLKASVQDWLWEREAIAASNPVCPASISLFAASLYTDMLWVSDWVSLHQNEGLWSWVMAMEGELPLMAGMLDDSNMVYVEAPVIPEPDADHSANELTAREQRWKEAVGVGGVRQATHLACWSASDCGGCLEGVIGIIKCIECCRTAHHECLGVQGPTFQGEVREVTCPDCLVAKCTATPTDEFRSQMANITLSAAGNDATSNERKERKTLVNAVRKYEDTHHLNSGSVCSVEEAGVAFLQTYATSGHVPQMKKMRKAMGRWLSEKKLVVWTEHRLAEEVLGSTAKKLEKGTSQAHKVDRTILKTAHLLLKEKVLNKVMSKLVASRVNAGQHSIFGASTRASEISGTDQDHGANVRGVRLGVSPVKLTVTPHAVGRVSGSIRAVTANWTDFEVEDSKMDPGKAIVTVSGDTVRRRLQEYAAAWGRSWINIESEGEPNVMVQIMDYKVMRVGLIGVVPGTKAGEIFLKAIVDAQTSRCFNKRFHTPVMMRWLAQTARARAQHPDPNKRWINTFDGTSDEMRKHAGSYSIRLQQLYATGMQALYASSKGKEGCQANVPLIELAVRWGPLFTTTAGHHSSLEITPMPLSSESMEKDLKSIWGEACAVLGMKDFSPSSHGGRGGACLLARSLAAQSGIDPSQMREYVDAHFRWSPEKDRMQILYSGHLPRQERMKITILFWVKDSEWDY